MCLPANRKGLVFADSEVKLKASISTIQASCEGSDLKADRTSAIPALSLTERLLPLMATRTAGLPARKLVLSPLMEATSRTGYSSSALVSHRSQAPSYPCLCPWVCIQRPHKQNTTNNFKNSPTELRGGWGQAIETELPGKRVGAGFKKFSPSCNQWYR